MARTALRPRGSADGVTWERTLLDGRRHGYAGIQDVASTGEGLVAIGFAGIERCTGSSLGGVRCRALPVAVWRSAEGRSWERVDTGTVFRGAHVTGLAAGPLGLLAIGADRQGHALVWRSTDGGAWEAARLEGHDSHRATLLAVAAFQGGWVIAGSTGGHPVAPGGGATPNGSSGSAWMSSDGVTWQPATVAGTGPQVELRSLYVAAAGINAVGSVTGAREGPSVWTSADGRTWDLAAADPDGLSTPVPIAADGIRIIAAIRGDPVAYSVSSDGVTWVPLADTDAVATMPNWAQGPTPTGATLGADGVLVTGEGHDLDQVLWHARFGGAVPVNPAIPPDAASPEVVLDAYLRALQAGDCVTAHALATRTFVIGDGELCGALTVTSATIAGPPARPSEHQAYFFTTLVVTGGDASMPDGSHDWFYILERQPCGAWRLTGGGSGP